LQLTVTSTTWTSVERFAKHFKRSPDQLNQDHLREYRAYLLRERKLEPATVEIHVSALRFFFAKTLKRTYLLDDIPYPKVPRRLAIIRPAQAVAIQEPTREVGRHLFSEPSRDEWAQSETPRPRDVPVGKCQSTERGSTSRDISSVCQ
jgi:integrase-like protein